MPTIEEIQRQAYRRSAQIEERYEQYHVPREIQAYYRLNELVGMRSVEEYLQRYPGLEIHIGDANDGKEEMGWGALSQFEKEAAQHLNERIARREQNERPIELLPSPRSLQLNG